MIFVFIALPIGLFIFALSKKFSKGDWFDREMFWALSIMLGLFAFLRGTSFPGFFHSFLRFCRASRWVAFLGNGEKVTWGRRLSGFLLAAKLGTVMVTIFWPRRLRRGAHLGFLRSGRRQLGQIDDLHGRVSKVMRGIVDQRRFRLDDAGSEVGRHLVQRHLAPQAGFGHDLVELLELAETRDVTLSFPPPGARDGETACACKGRVFAELLVDVLRLGRLPSDHHAQEGVEHAKETLRRPASETRRRDAGTQAAGIDPNRGHLRGR